LNGIRQVDKPVFLLINKLDTVKKKRNSPCYRGVQQTLSLQGDYSLSALKTSGIDVLLETVVKYIPEGRNFIPMILLRTRWSASWLAEIIREKIMEATQEEVPYSSAVEIQQWQERDDGVVFIQANIYIERDGQKGIIIGNKGARLKSIGTKARPRLSRVSWAPGFFLELWVKIKKDWRSDEYTLRELGFR